MKILQKRIFEGYEFYCEECGAKLQAKHKEIKNVGHGIYAFKCPCCHRISSVKRSKLHNVTIMKNC